MDMAIQIPTRANSWEVALRAEQLGYSHACFYDTALLNAELFAAMAVAAVKTSKIKLCTGVMVPSNRLAPIAASGLATLNALAPGRIVFGVSTGFTARRAMGLKPITLARMCKYIEVVQGLLAGQMVDWDEEGEKHKIRFVHPDPDLDIINIKDPIPLAISAFGPKARATISKYGAQWIGGSEHGQAELDEVRGQWTAAGRDPKDLYSVCLLGGRVMDEGEPFDSPKMLAQAGPSASIAFHYMAEEASFGSMMAGSFPFPEEFEAYRKVYEAYEPADARYLSNHRGHLMFLRPDEKHITGPVMKMLTTSGTKVELVERMRRIKDIGFSQVQFHSFPGHENEMMERWADVMSAV